MALQKKQPQNQSKRAYLSISHGKIVRDNGGVKEYFSSIDGTLERIYSKERTFGNERVNRWYIDLRDGAELYSICLPYNSGTFKSIILSLASDNYLTSATPIVIEPYEGRNGFTKVVVWSEGVKLDWITKELPEVKEVIVGGKVIKDESERMDFIINLVNTINSKLKK